MRGKEEMMSWYCIYTKRSSEESVCKSLTRLKDIEIFNPKIKMKKNLRGKSVEVVEELFPAYIFSRFELPQYFHMISYTRGVKSFVGDRSGKPYAVDEGIVEFIKSRMDSGYVCMEPAKLTPGEQVTILDGPLATLSGVFLSESKPGERVLILLNTIQYQPKVEVPSAFVERKGL